MNLITVPLFSNSVASCNFFFLICSYLQELNAAPIRVIKCTLTSNSLSQHYSLPTRLSDRPLSIFPLSFRINFDAPTHDPSVVKFNWCQNFSTFYLCCTQLIFPSPRSFIDSFVERSKFSDFFWARSKVIAFCVIRSSLMLSLYLLANCT
jgi:hypothetical protein